VRKIPTSKRRLKNNKYLYLQSLQFDTTLVNGLLEEKEQITSALLREI